MDPYGGVVTQQPPGFGEPPGTTPVNGVTVRCMRNDTEDAEFAGKLSVEAFRGKFVHNVTENKLPAAVRMSVAFNKCQDPSYYQHTFIAELDGRKVGVAHLKFYKDKEQEPRDFDFCGEFGCWHGCRLICMHIALDEAVKENRCYLDHICVDDSARGKGVGKVLMERVEYEARVRYCRVIYLAVLTTNRAKNLYERQGYHVTSTESMCGCLRCCIGPPGAVYTMEKQL